MPKLNIQTNQTVPEEEKESLLAAASDLLVQSLGKPEDYIMVSLRDQCPMCFAGTFDSAVFLELKSIGLSGSQTTDLSARLCAFIEEHLDVSRERVNIEFASPARDMWGWNGKTFA